jgi:L-threonylcarbamoyladenylate synthase
MNAPIGTDVPLASQLIAAGRLVAFPTETVYGLGANALDTAAVAGVFAAKERPHFDPLIVHVATLEAARDLVTGFSDTAVRLAERFWPGPLTLVLPKVDRVPDLVTAGLPSVAVRIPAHPIALELIERAGVPIAAPSANPFGQVSPTTAQHVAAQLADRIDYILDGGPCRVGVESTVLHLGGERPLLLRPGGVSLEDLEDLIGPVETLQSSPSSDDGPQAAPGLLERHYAPRTPLQIIDQLPPPDQRSQFGLLTLGPLDEADTFAAVEVLSPTADLTEAAAHFYAALRRLDAAGLTRILARRFPQTGLGRALNDRLQRAAQR